MPEVERAAVLAAAVRRATATTLEAVDLVPVAPVVQDPGQAAVLEAAAVATVVGAAEEANKQYSTAPRSFLNRQPVLRRTQAPSEIRHRGM